MFWDKIIELCNDNGISPSKLCETLNFSNATATKWKNGATPHDSTLKKIADYFNVSIDYLAGRTSKQENLGEGSWHGGKESTAIPNDGLNPKIHKITHLLETKDIPDEVINFIYKALENYNK